MSSLGDLMVRVGANIDGFEKAMGTVGQRLRAIDRDVNRTFGGFDRIGGKLTTIGQSMSVGVTLPLAAVGVAVTKMASDFDLGLRKVGSLVGGFSQNEMKALTDQTLAVSRALGIDAVKATEALYEAVSAGIPQGNMVEFLKVAAPAAIAGVTDTKVAVDALTSVINAYGLKASDAKGLADQMFQAVNVGKFTFEQLAGSISIAVPLAAQMGIKFGDVAAAASTLTGQGFSVNEAMTSVRSAMVAILTPNTQMNGLLKEAGFQSGEVMLKTLGFQGSLEKLREASHGNNQVLTESYGRVEALGAALGLTGDKAATARGHIDSIKRASEGAGAATLAYNEINKSTTRQFEMAVTAIKATAIELGVALLPSVNQLLQASVPLVQMLTSVVQWFTKLPQEVQTTALGFTAAIAVIGPVTLALGTLVSTIAQVSAAFVSLAGISGMGSLLPALGALPGMFSNVAFAVTNGLTAALTGGEAIILRMGQAAILAAAAFAAWHLGTWAYEQIPGVKALGDGMADLIMKIPGVTAAMDKLSGVSDLNRKTLGSQEDAVKSLEGALKRKGIVVERGTKTLGEYQEALEKAARESGRMGNAQDTQRAKIELAKKEIQRAKEAADILARAHQELSGKTRKAADDTVYLTQKTKEYKDGIPAAIVRDYDQRVVALTRSIAHQTIEAQIAAAQGRDWSSQLERNTEDALALARQIDTMSGSTLPTYVVGLGNISKASKTMTDDLKLAVEDGKDAYEDLYKAADKSAKDQAKGWNDFGREVSTVFTNFAQSVAKDFFDGELSMGEKFKSMLSSLGQAVLGKFLEPATKAVGEFISNTIADLLGGKGFGGVLDSLKKVGDSIADIFGAGASAAGNAAGAAGGAAGSGTGAAGGVASAASSGLTAMITAVASVGSMISGIVGNFQFAHMNTALGRIEESTRYVKIWTGEQSQNMLWCLQTMTERSGYQTASLDAIGRFASESLAWLQRIGAATEHANEIALMPATAGGGLTITMTNVSFGSRGDVDYMLDQIGRRMRERGQSF